MPYLRNLLILATVGALAGRATPAAATDTATLVMADLCDDPSEAFDYEWSHIKHGSSALFFLQPDGTVSAVTTGASAFNTYTKIYVAAHGGSQTIGNFSYDDFVNKLHHAHPGALREVFFAVCGSGAGKDNLLEKVSVKYGKEIDKLTGGISACALVGKGDRNLAHAEYLVSVTQSDPALYHKIVTNIGSKWNASYPSQHKDYGTVCREATAPFHQAHTLSFVTTVLSEFSQPAHTPETSTDYLDLVRLNNGGSAMKVCGKNPHGSGPVACD